MTTQCLWPRRRLVGDIAFILGAVLGMVIVLAPVTVGEVSIRRQKRRNLERWYTAR
jgi:hypothetical protein